MFLYEFVLYSRKGYTTGEFRTLLEAGRLDIVYQCILMSVFRSHSHRHDVKFHAFLNGPPDPPVHLEVNGDELYDVRLDERSWEKVLKKVLSGGRHTGISTSKESLQAFIKSRAASGIKIFVLEEKGKHIAELDMPESAIFVLGDHIGLPKNDEKFLLKYGEKVSLGKHQYLAASCIDIINYTLDKQVLEKFNIKR
jgi:tRNA (pseudouridine54-N1)-methyltransferase